MIEDLIYVDQLMTILGYADPRSVVKWCKSNKIPLIKIGLKKYIQSHYLTQIIDNQLVIFDEVRGAENLTKEFSSKHSETYKPQSDIENKYLSKYETKSKYKPPGQGKT